MPRQCFALFSYWRATCQNYVIYEAFATVSLCSWPHTHISSVSCFVSFDVQQYIHIAYCGSLDPGVPLVTPRLCHFSLMSPTSDVILKNSLATNIKAAADIRCHFTNVWSTVGRVWHTARNFGTCRGTPWRILRHTVDWIACGDTEIQFPCTCD